MAVGIGIVITTVFHIVRMLPILFYRHYTSYQMISMTKRPIARTLLVHGDLNVNPDQNNMCATS